MSSNIRFILYLMAFVLVGAWLFTVVKSCNENKVQRTQSFDTSFGELESNEKTVSLTDDEIDRELDVILTEAEAPNEESASSESTIEIDASFDYTRPPKQPVEKSVAEPTVNRKPKTNTPSTSSGRGQYLVVAGSYGVRNNADKQKKRISKLGYSSAEVKQFDGAKYYTVIASRHTSQKAAESDVSALKSKGVEAYVKKRQE